MRRFLELDQRYSYQLHIDQKRGPLRRLAIILAHSGDSWFWGAGLVILWLLGNQYWKDFAVVEFFGIFVTALIVMTVKFSVRRRRPESNWGSIYRSTDPHSFPSGHAARAMMIAVIALAIGPTWLGILLLIWAPCVSLARVAMGVHYLSDVTAGLTLGGIIGFVVGVFLPVLDWWGYVVK